MRNRSLGFFLEDPDGLRLIRDLLFPKCCAARFGKSDNGVRHSAFELDAEAAIEGASVELRMPTRIGPLSRTARPLAPKWVIFRSYKIR